MSGPLSFLASNTHLATRNPKFRTEIKPEYGKDFFFTVSRAPTLVYNLKLR